MKREKTPVMDYSKEEADRRFEAALRGARIAGHKAKDSMTPKRQKAQPPRKRKASAPKSA